MHEFPVLQLSSRATKLCEIDHCMTNYIYALRKESSVVKLYIFPLFLIF